jgi:hypothetical protein
MRAGDGAVAVTVTADAVALAVALTTQAAGYFSPNYFLARLDEGGAAIPLHHLQSL